MANKTMPEQLFIDVIPFDISGESITYSGSNDQEIVKNPVKYVRADIAAGDSDEPLADGQVRWVRAFWCGWSVVTVKKSDIKSSCRGEDDWIFERLECGSAFSMSGDDFHKLGPVIRPPKNIL